MTRTAREPLNLDELNEKEQDELSELLMGELHSIACGNFVLCGDPILVSSRQVSVNKIEEDEEEKEEEDGQNQNERINVLELGAYSVVNQSNADLSAQSNIPNNYDIQSSANQTSIFLHTEMGTKEAKSGTKAIPAPRGSAAYGSEIEYRQVGVGVMVGSSKPQEESEEEEEGEEEYEEELTEEQHEPIPEEDGDMISRKTSFSSFYVIDE